MTDPTPPIVTELPVRVRRYGRDEPLPDRRTLRAGPLTAILENGDLRYLSVDGTEIVRRIYVAVRNQNWDTIPPRFTRYEVADDGRAFAVHLGAIHQSGDVDFSWEGTILGTAAGTITCSMDGVVGSDFLRNRIGFCVLHPPGLAGLPASVETPDGAVEGVFPERISPHQPFVDMAAIAHPAGDIDARVTIRFAGDLFEMEDQRNWTDASYKTYGTPLRLPYPVRVTAGEKIAQRVTVEVAASVPLAEDEHPAAAPPDLHIEPGRAVPLPPIGFGLAGQSDAPSDRATALLRAAAPAHLRLVLDLGDERWIERLDRASADAHRLDAPLELELLTDPTGEAVVRFGDRLAGATIPLARVLVFPPKAPDSAPRTDMTTGAAALAAVRDALDRAGVGVPVGGGSRADFTELNRATDLPLDGMDIVAYPMNAQVHASDLLSVIETMAGQAATAESARAIAGGKALAIGPISLKPRFNPNARGPVLEAGPDELPPSVDPRQLSLFGAGWTVGSLQALIGAGADSLTYYETTGWRGLIEREEGLTRQPLFPSQPGMAFPVYHVFGDLAPFRGGEVVPVATADPLAVAALALRAGERVRLLAANLTDEERDVAVSAPGLVFDTVRKLDETTYGAATADPTAYREIRNALDPGVPLRLLPFAVATLDGRVADDDA